LIALLAVSACALAGAARAEIVWSGDYETGSLSQWGGVQAVQGGAAVTTVPVRSGAHAARFVVRPGDDPINSSGERAEVLTSTGEGAGTESWWAWSTFFGDDFEPALNTSWNIFTQWHNSGTAGQANVHFEVNAATNPWTIQLRKFGGEPTTNQVVFPLALFERNRWFDFVFHVRWAPDLTGFVEVWVNGAQVVPLTYTPTTYFGQSVYLKQGFYRADANVTSVVYHDGTRRGLSFADVADPTLVTGSSPTIDPPTPPTEPAAEVGGIEFIGKPRVLRGKRLRIKARSVPVVWTSITVRGPRGRLLARRWTRTEADGLLHSLMRVRSWHGQRFVVVTLKADGRRIAAIVRRPRS
jgi:hypothetical protein